MDLDRLYVGKFFQSLFVFQPQITVPFDTYAALCSSHSDMHISDHKEELVLAKLNY